MSGTASVPNTFASAVTATGLQLDANYNTIVAYLNDPTNRNNYAADTGNTNTIALAAAPAVTAYAAGLGITFKANNTNAGGVKLIANSAGTRTVVNADGSALSPGQILAGSIYQVLDDGTRAIFISPAIPASQAQMETATASATFVTPSAFKFHPGAAKAAAWWNGTATGTLAAAERNLYGISAVSRAGAGTWSFALTTAFSNTQFVVVTGHAPTAGLALLQELPGARTTAGFVIRALDTATTAVDLIWGNLTVHGDLP